MRIISEKALRVFGNGHSDAVAPLAVWKRVVRAANWKLSADVKATFPNSDRVGDKTVFDIAQNRYRLIAYISFKNGLVFVKEILRHKEYDKGAWK